MKWISLSCLFLLLACGLPEELEREQQIARTSESAAEAEVVRLRSEQAQMQAAFAELTATQQRERQADFQALMSQVNQKLDGAVAQLAQATLRRKRSESEIEKFEAQRGEKIAAGIQATAQGATQIAGIMGQSWLGPLLTIGAGALSTFFRRRTANA